MKTTLDLLTQPGQKLIRVWGRQERVDTPPLGVPGVFEARVLVQ